MMTTCMYKKEQKNIMPQSNDQITAHTHAQKRTKNINIFCCNKWKTSFFFYLNDISSIALLK